MLLVSCIKKMFKKSKKKVLKHSVVKYNFSLVLKNTKNVLKNFGVKNISVKAVFSNFVKNLYCAINEILVKNRNFGQKESSC